MVYLTSMIKGLLITQGVEVVWAFRIPFFIFIAIGTLCAFIASFSIKEKDYVVPKSCSFSMLKSMKETFRYRIFAVMAVGFLVMWISFGFFNASLVYDITVLLALPDIWMTIVPGISIVVTLIFYPIVGKIAKTFGKKIPLCVAMGIYALLYFGVYLCGVFNIAESPTLLKIVVAVIIGVCNGIPLAATNTIPPCRNRRLRPSRHDRERKSPGRHVHGGEELLHEGDAVSGSALCPDRHRHRRVGWHDADGFWSRHRRLDRVHRRSRDHFHLCFL
jgi:Na+/melibiose symporter-like transporter